jgi:tRNA(Arg) A34 adenosine deaminase TadA
MRAAILMAARNPYAPFGAVIVKTVTGEVLGRGVNNSGANPTLHGEIAAINDYTTRHGSKGWEATTLYTTAEPCAMCMSAIVWARIARVVFGTSIDGLKEAGIDQIQIAAAAVAAAAPFYHGELRGGVLAAQTDALFKNRKRR